MSIRILSTVDPQGSVVRAFTDDGHPIVMDAAPPDGEGSAAEPKEALLAALAGCTGMDVASILRKKRQVPATHEIAVSAESASEHPRVFTSVIVEHRVSGVVQAEAVRRSIELSATKYCPVNAILSASVPIEHWYRLKSDDGSTTEFLVAVTGPRGSQVMESPRRDHETERSS